VRLNYDQMVEVVDRLKDTQANPVDVVADVVGFDPLQESSEEYPTGIENLEVVMGALYRCQKCNRWRLRGPEIQGPLCPVCRRLV
jgi:NADH:ubiquinone oxidoreductase subunit C